MRVSRNKLRSLILEALEKAEREAMEKASASERKRVYRKLVKKYHPDRNPNNPKAEAAAKELNNLYDELENGGNSQRNQQYDEPEGSSGGFSSASYGPWGDFQWDSNPKTANDFSEEELKTKIKEARLVEGEYGFEVLYKEFIRRAASKQEGIKAKWMEEMATKRFNEVNSKSNWTCEVSKNGAVISNIEYDSNNLANFKISFGQSKLNKRNITFSSIYRSLRMLKETSLILGQRKMKGIPDALNAFKVAARYSPLALTAEGKREIQESIALFEKVNEETNSMIKRGKYKVLGLKHPNAKAMKKMISRISSLNSSESVSYFLYHAIFS